NFSFPQLVVPANNVEMLISFGKYHDIQKELIKTGKSKNLSFFSKLMIVLKLFSAREMKRIIESKYYLGKICGAGSSMITINETGTVFACEPLWKELGQLRKEEFNLEKILDNNISRVFRKECNTCSCT